MNRRTIPNYILVLLITLLVAIPLSNEEALSFNHSNSYQHQKRNGQSSNPSPTPKPTPAPTPKPTPDPTPALTTQFSNAQEWPASFRPYASDSPWNTTLPDNAKPYANNSAVMASMAFSQPPFLRTQEAGQYDYEHPVYFATDTDPLLNTKCTKYCNGIIPKQIRVPAKARPAGGGDSHMAVIQPDGTEVDMWGTEKPSSNWVAGQTISASTVTECGNFYTGSGFAPVSGYGATAGGACLAGGVVRPAELQAGLIQHALFLATNCTGNIGLYPAPSWGGGSPCSNGASVPMGARVQLTLTDAQIDALNASKDQKTLLHALHDYGAYVMDTGGGTVNTHLLGVGTVEDQQPYVSFGVPVPFDQYAIANGWYSAAISGTSEPRYFSPDTWQVTFDAATVQIVDPCYAEGTCN